MDHENGDNDIFLHKKLNTLNQDGKECSSAKDYDDYEENIPKHGAQDGIGYWGSVAHIVRAAVGTGILLLPLEMKNLGYFTGTFLLLAVSFVYYHILHILLQLDSRLCKHFKLKRLTYALVVDKTFAIAPAKFHKYRKPLLYLIYIYYIVPTNAAMTLIITSSNIQKMVKYHDIDLNFTVIITSLTIILTIFCMFKSILKILVPFSCASNLCSFAIVVLIIICSTIYKNPKARMRPFAGNSSLLLRSVAIYLNSLLSTGMILTVSNGMKKPQRMQSTFGSLNVSAFIVVAFYTGFSLIAYINFGDNIRENILDNIPVSNFLILGINLVYSLALTVPYVLSFYASFDVIWASKFQTSLEDSKYKYISEYGVRIGYNAFAYFLALGVSNLALISAIAGVLSILLDVALMPFLQLLLMYSLREKNQWIMCKNCLLIVFCSVLFLLSMVDCVNEVAKLYAS